MNQIDSNKYLNIINKKNKIDKKIFTNKYLDNLLIRTLLVIVSLLFITIIYKNNDVLKDKINKYFFYEGISFAEVKKVYNKYLGGVLPTIKEDTVTEVFNEKLNYSSSSIYYDGVKLSVSDGYLVPTLDEGMVVFIGEKDNYGKTVIIENLDGIYYWYGNIINTSLKLYDYVEKGSLVGEVNNDLYMIFSKNGKFLNYEEYI